MVKKQNVTFKTSIQNWVGNVSDACVYFLVEIAVNIVIGCEDNDLTVVPPVQLSCPIGGQVIEVIRASYGRNEPYSKVSNFGQLIYYLRVHESQKEVLTSIDF